MLHNSILFVFLILLALTAKPSKEKSNDKENRYRRAERLTYEHFKKACNDEEMKRFLIANFQDPKEYEGLSRITICEKMRQKARLTGEEYTRFPF